VQEIKNLGDPGRISGGVGIEQFEIVSGVPVRALSITGEFATHKAVKINRDLEDFALLTDNRNT
jgi:hypothetical protein